MFRRLFKKRLRKHEIDEEFEAHVALEAQLLEERGLSREQAHWRARRSFGNQSQIAEQTRDVWVWLWFEHLVQDLRYAVRTLLRNRAFTPAVILSIALGSGAGTAVYSIADAVFLRPLPYTHPEQLLWVAVRFPKMGIEFLGSPDYVAWRRDNRSFENLAATQPSDETSLLNGEHATEVHVMRVSANFLRTLGVGPALGRDFTPGEERENGPKPILLTDHFREQHFGAGSNAIGQIVRLDGHAYTVIGILPRSFVFPTDAKVDLLTTLSISPDVSYSDRMVASWHVYGRVKPGVSVAQAQADLEHLFDRGKEGLSRLIPSRRNWYVNHFRNIE